MCHSAVLSLQYPACLDRSLNAGSLAGPAWGILRQMQRVLLLKLSCLSRYESTHTSKTRQLAKELFMILVSSVFLVRLHTLPRVKVGGLTMTSRSKPSVLSIRARISHVCDDHLK